MKCQEIIIYRFYNKDHENLEGKVSVFHEDMCEVWACDRQCALYELNKQGYRVLQFLYDVNNVMCGEVVLVERDEKWEIKNYKNEIKNINLSDIAIKIKKIIGEDQIFNIDFFSNQICFNIYEKEVVISYTSNDNMLYMNCELTNGKLATKTINELNQIMNLLEANKDLLRSFCE